MKVRPARPEDVERLKRILRAAYSPFLEDLGDAPPPLMQDVAADIAAGDCLVAANPPLGFAIVRTSPGKAHLENLAVDPAAQRGGIGRALVAAAEAQALAAGAKRLTLATHPAMTATRGFYAHLGYNETATEAGKVMLERAL